MDHFSKQDIHCEAPISIIADILWADNFSEYDKNLNSLKNLGIEKVKDLVNALSKKFIKETIDDGTLQQLSGALKIFYEQCELKCKSAFFEFNEKNFIKTQNICQDMLEYFPNDLQLLLLMSASCFYCKEYDKSLIHLEKALLLRPAHPDLLRNKGSILWEQSKTTEAVQNYYDALTNAYYYDSCWDLYCKALILLQPEEETEIIYQSILSYRKDLSNIHCDYGNFLLSFNAFEESRKQYMLAMASQKYPRALDCLGCLSFKTNNINGAVDFFSKAVDLDPSLVQSWINLGMCFLRLSNTSRTIDVLERAYALQPKNFLITKYLALAYIKQNNIPSAIEVHQRFLKFDPDDIKVNYYLAKIYFHFLNDYQEAEKYFQKCMKLYERMELKLDSERCREILFYLFEVYIKLNKKNCASKIMVLKGDSETDLSNKKYAYYISILLDPKNAEGFWSLGIIYYQMNEFEMAIKCYKSSLAIKPNFTNAYCDCALVYDKLNNFEEAINYYNMAIQLDPDHIVAIENLALLYKKLGNIDEFIRLNEILLKNKQIDSYDIHIELANIYSNIKGDHETAVYHIFEAMSIQNTQEEVYLKLGNLYLELKRYEDALESFNKALMVNENCPIAHTNIGSILKDNGKFNEAIKSYSKALELQSDFPEAYCNLVQCLQHVCNWDNYDSRIKKLKDIINNQLDCQEVPSLLPNHSLLYPFHPETLKKIASKYAEECIKKCISKKLIKNFTYSTSLPPNECINVGYVSSNFMEHSISQLIESIVSLHDKNNFEVFCYSLSSCGSFSESFKVTAASYHFKDISKINVTDAAKKINDDSIHILVNMDGYSTDALNEIFALRPAPIQVSWLGYLGTSGASFIDYLITDKVCCPPKLKHYYTEKLAYMNQSVFIGNHKQNFSHQRISPKAIDCEKNPIKTTVSMTNGNFRIKSNSVNEMVSTITSSMNNVNLLSEGSNTFYTRQMYNLPENVIVYCNFNKLYKIEPSTFSVWITILKRVPNSVLWLLHISDDSVKNLLEFANMLNIDPSRIIFSNVEPIDKHMIRIQLADIFLDTLVYNDHKVYLDALWAGIPVITLPGETFASRVAASQLTTLGCDELIAQNKEEYIAKAIELGSNKTKLEDLKSRIWTLKMESNLFDCKSYTNELEIVYKNMWNNFLSENY